jgi:LPS-assembly protein
MVFRLCHILLALVLSLGIAPQAMAQEQATLVANSLRIESGDRLVAEGSVEVFFKGRKLVARRLTFDRAADRLLIEGPITLSDGEGTVILASQADLKADLSEGILRSARVVMDQQLQLAAAEVFRVNGRYTAMTKVIASSCKVCAASPTPLWEIRAKRVVHDQEARQIFFDNASFRLAGLPVFYIPRLRMPDPSLKRASGFLMPSLHSSSTLGFGIRQPYFLTLGKSRDLTITPFLTTKGARLVELRYRQAFRAGDVTVAGTVANDALLPGQLRGHLTADGRFELPQEFVLTFHGETVTDEAFLLDYGLSSQDRLDSRIEINRTRRNEHVSARLIGIQTLRAGEPSDTLASQVGDLTWQRRFSLGPLGGQGGLRFQAHNHWRSSISGVDPDGDGLSEGRDVLRARLRADWRREWIATNGLVFGVLGEAAADFYSVGDDLAFGGAESRTHTALAAELRWPLIKASADGVTQLIEPVVQLVWAPTSTESLYNEDSRLVEFDQGNLFALNRFPGTDAVERGIRANIGLNYLRKNPDGWSIGATVGRVLRANDLGQFTSGSGLNGYQSDWLAAFQLVHPDGVGLTNRVLMDDDLSPTKVELLFSLDQDRYGLEAGYLFHRADSAEGRTIDTNEITLDGRFDLGSSGWTANLSNRYDLEADRASKAAIGLGFHNECLSVDLSLSRRFTSSTSVRPTTDFSLSLELLGFGGGKGAGPSRQCRG